MSENNHNDILIQQDNIENLNDLDEAQEGVLERDRFYTVGDCIG